MAGRVGAGSRPPLARCSGRGHKDLPGRRRAGLQGWFRPLANSGDEGLSFRICETQPAAIPVLLPGAPEAPELPLFLRSLHWVDLKGGLSEEGIYQLQWGITGENPRAKLASSSSHSEAALAEARRSNDAFEKSNAIAKESLELANRAWVIATKIEAPIEFAPGLFEATVTMENHGRIPATNAVVQQTMAIIPQSVFIKATPRLHGEKENFAVIPVGQPVQGRVRYRLSEEEVKAIVNGERDLYYLSH